jgi:hypothetical protein
MIPTAVYCFVDADRLQQIQELCEAKGVLLLGHQFDSSIGQLTVTFLPKIRPGARMVAIGFAVKERL